MFFKSLFLFSLFISFNLNAENIEIKDINYYFSNSISRASKTMSECRQINQNSKKSGTDN